MKKIIRILNTKNFHYEIIESIIVNYKQILNIDNDNVQIYLDVVNNPSFKQYIKNKYKNIIFKAIKKFYYSINCSVYPANFPFLKKKKHLQIYNSSIFRKILFE